MPAAPEPVEAKPSHKRLYILTALMLLLVGAAFFIFWQSQDENNQQVYQPANATELKPPKEPQLKTETVLENLRHPWDIAFLPSGELIFSERGGSISLAKNGAKQVLHTVSGTYVSGEGGLMGIAVDKDFAANRYLFACFNASTASGIDIRVARFRLAENLSGLSERKDIITSIPSNTSGRHSGCQLETAKDGTLWVGTGDAANSAHPQDPVSLGGKILHVTRDGMPTGDNLPAPYDPRIFSYGHRNTQGLVIFDQPVGDVFGYSVEQGSDIDDEVNLLKRGNFGWAPKPPYNESGVPMTDNGRFPESFKAIWSSGPTIAASGLGYLKGEQWGTWQDAIAVGILKGQHLRVLKFDSAGTLTLEKPILANQFGRIRAATLGPDGALYFSTDKSSGAQIIKLTASQP